MNIKRVCAFELKVLNNTTSASKRVKMGVVGVEAAERRYPDGVVL